MNEEEIKDLSLKFQGALLEGSYQLYQKLQQENQQLKERIDKAIEYNKKNIHSHTLAKILKGENNE